MFGELLDYSTLLYYKSELSGSLEDIQTKSTRP